MPTFLTFDRFLESVDRARPPTRRRLLESHTGRDFAATSPGRTEFERMRNYIQRLYQGVHPRHSYQDVDGEPVDCIPVEEQPALGRLTRQERSVPFTPPDYAGPNTEDQDVVGLSSRRPDVDPFGQPRLCPEGTIPMRRLTLARLTRFATLDQFLQKAPGGDRPPTIALADRPATVRGFGAGTGLIEEHRYAHAYQYDVGSCQGASAWLNVWKPVAAPGVFSLSQLWITSAGDPSGAVFQTIEGGWQVYPEHYGHDQPVLFLFFTNAGYNPAYGGSRGYNLEVPAFVQTGASWTIGGPLPSWSVAGGPQRGFRMHWQRDPQTGHWWLFLQGSGAPEPIGFYPRSLFGTGPLSRFASRIDFGGEVAAPPGVPTTGQMGSGAFSGQGYGFAAFQKEIAFLNGDAFQPARLTPQATHPQLYTVDVGHDDANWKTHLFFGGPGDN